MASLLSDFDYTLPPELIALYPPKDRVSARLMVVDRETGKHQQRRFSEILDFLNPGDLLVLNNSRVIPARIFTSRKTGGKVELFLLREREPQVWTALVRPNRKVKKGDFLNLGDPKDKVTVEALDDSVPKSGERLLRFHGKPMKDILNQYGHIPLPPYIARQDDSLDRELYQTVYAKEEGSVAAPTAGLHFNEKLLADLRKKGVEIAEVTLHVGYGTFQSIGVEDLSQHQMHEEMYEVTEQTAGQINRACQEGRRIIACGTTALRVLESAADLRGRVTPGRASTRLFIYDPYKFKAAQGMITNFHLPKSTLLCLADAFLGGRRLLDLYQKAIDEHYHFYSYGDAMLIL
ncbi:MAG: tRNA preQ1(34) S-adenosylmethionine ribosyltransferase-isomerase QueA [Candidatus Omnitrophica bacterium]|nr:tRNA preQ1(34) S-adenosylmethionine ribosyltransferase-isomerase QueA [Candidatus Omnitrophota bacterium]